jgi:signal transduction histidine kinase
MNPRLGLGGKAVLGRGTLLLLFLAAIVVIIHASSRIVLQTASESFDEELGLRLTTVAEAAVTAATPELLLDPDVARDTFVRRIFEELAARHGLERIFLVDEGGVTRFDLSGEAPGRRSPFVDLDPAAFERALEGSAAASHTFEVGGDVLKSAFAPVESWDGEVRGVLGVAAGADFLIRVRALRRTLFGIGAGSAAIVALLGVLFFGATRRLARAEAALARSETLATMGMMAAGVAHEIRNPLAIISAAAARLKKKLAGSEAAGDELLDFIPEEVRRLNDILEGYLRFARDEPLARVECDLAHIVQRTAALTRETLRESGISLEVEGAERAGTVFADPQRMQQVLLNLLLNAAQAMPAGGSITVGLDADEKRATLRVADRGVGFSKQGLETATAPFVTTKDKGSGLGLAMARRIVEAHGGTLELGNREGGGAIVTVTLPRTSAA